MSPNEEKLLYLLDCAANGRAADSARFADTDWQSLFMQAQEHKIDGLLLDTVCALEEAVRPAQEVLVPWQQSAMVTLMAQSFLVAQLHALLAAFEDAGVQAITLKGVALKMLYPNPDLRTMSDADLLVGPQKFGDGCAVMESQGYTLTEREPGVNVYVGPDGLRVELHERLFDRTAYGFLSRLDEEKQFPLSLARREAVYGGEAWVFPPLEHALFMLCHMAKHMITTGFGLRQAMDFALFVRAHDADMAWDAFWEEAQTLGLAPFASALLELSARHFSLPRGAWSRGARADAAAAEGLLDDLLDAGVFGHRTEERKRSAAVVYRSFEAENGDSGRVRRALFPSAATLKAPYLYARAHPWLLPVAWVHRWGRYVLSILRGRTSRTEAAESLRVADERLRLLSRLGLRDKR